ncbi:MAG: hypothetical protein ACOX1I_09215 [Dethiobacteria bacterium]|jgi:hypothetical protein
MRCNLEEMKKEIAALIPASHPQGGEATLLITVKGEKILDRRSINWIIRRLAEYHNIDLRAIKKNYGPLLGKKRFIPLPLSQKLVYLPLTLKTDTIPVDKRMAYISLEQIGGVERKENLKESTVNILLRCGIELACCNALATIRTRIRDSKLIQKIILSEQEEKGKYVFNLEGRPAFIAENGPEHDEIARLTAALLYFSKSHSRNN